MILRIYIMYVLGIIVYKRAYVEINPTDRLRAEIIVHFSCFVNIFV